MTATTEARTLVVNADDFGFSPGVNRAIVHAHLNGIVTSTSLMVRATAAAAAVAMSRGCSGLAIGLHLDLGEWAFDDGEWRPVYEVVDTSRADAVAHEIRRQVDAFHDLVGRKPTHIDSHQHVHLRPAVRRLAIQVARELQLPLRHCTPGISYCGRFYGQTTEGEPLPDAISVASLQRVVADLGSGVTELACHPGEGDDAGTMYSAERRQELSALCHPAVRTALETAGVALASFAELTAARPGYFVPPDDPERLQ